MTKKAMPTRKANAKPKAMTADDHRRMAAQLDARSSIHHAKARLMEAMNPPKGSKRNMVKPY